MQVINIPTPVCHNGQHYQGVSVHNGVEIQSKPWPCNPNRMAMDFVSCAQDTTGLYVDFGVAAVSFDDEACPVYLQLTPAA